MGPVTQDGFVREVDEAVRQDQIVGWLQRYGLATGVAIVVVLLGLAGWLWWSHAQKAAADARAEQYIQAMDLLEGGQLDAAAKQLQPLAEKGGDGTQASAAILRAGITAQQGKVKEAADQFARIAADPKAPQPYRDLASLREVALKFDSLPVDQVIARLKPLAVPGNPWFGSAGELLADAYLKQGHKDLAGPLFAQIARDKDVSESLRRRARQIAGLLGVDALDDISEFTRMADAPPPAAAGPAQPQAAAPAAPAPAAPTQP